ncbi:YitT family protein [Breznakia pachnodae]|uniref:Uncharacterized membrane-anchored protein YitT (DUF2179 family) n=1 Tax=Breznakia pachnodae TaxID=265178 RepID=A0ABU0E8T8_9FIRM|nr:YitT family protein [Breznakia pachnodae]MDQ0363313.1 uncharacterized membrane-anchored protein YitT (DUF2179 family) [Breznakia pachnodae]
MKLIRKIPIITFSIFLIALSINMFLGPHHVAAGGVSGIGILLEAFLGINRSFIVMILNIVMLGLAFQFLGKKTFINILAGSILLPILLYIVPEYKMLDDHLLSVISGSMIFGAGVAILYRIDASSGGTTIPPMIFKKYFNLNTSVGLLLTDLVIVVFNIFIFGMESFFLAILSLILTSVVMSYMETAFHQRKLIMVRSYEHLEEIKMATQAIIDRKVTMVNVSDTLSVENNNNNMLMLVANQQQYKQIVKLIDTIDKNAVIIVNRVAEVHGISFSYYSA